MKNNQIYYKLYYNKNIVNLLNKLNYLFLQLYINKYFFLKVLLVRLINIKLIYLIYFFQF